MKFSLPKVNRDNKFFVDLNPLALLFAMAYSFVHQFHDVKSVNSNGSIFEIVFDT